MSAGDIFALVGLIIGAAAVLVGIATSGVPAITPRVRSISLYAGAGLLILAVGVFIGSRLPNTQGSPVNPPTLATQPSSLPASPSPPTTSGRPPDPKIAFTQPMPNDSIGAGQPLYVSGTVEGLNGDKLWILIKPEVGNGSYYLSYVSPVADSDGPWSFTANAVGDKSDVGHHIAFIAVKANQACSDSLARAQRDSSGANGIPLLPNGCVPLAPSGVVIVR
jgi:hypothetical protein